MEGSLKRAFGYCSEQRKRSENQDAFGVFPFDGYTLAVVCDGMGGHVGGAQASTLAVRTIHDYMQSATSAPADALRNALERANQAIYEAARKNHRLTGMGTTAVAAVVTDDGVVHIAHVGDSRAYIINEGQAVQVTRDHTMVNLFVDAELLTPEDAATHPEAHVLSRSLGVERQIEVELSEPIELADNDVVFLCSDGVHGVVTDWELSSVDWKAPESGIRHVLDIVSAREGDDNATAVAVLIGDGDSMPASPLPEPRSVDELPDIANLETVGTALPEDEDDPYLASDPASHSTEPSAPSRESVPTPAPIEPPAAEAPAQAPVKKVEPSAPAPSSNRKRLALAAVAVLVLGTGVLGVTALAVQALTGDEDDSTYTQLSGDDVVPADPGVPDHPQLTPDTPAAVTPPAALDTQPAPTGDDRTAPETAPPGEDTPPTEALRIEIPKAPRRLPHRATRHNLTPPRGPHMFQAVQAARDRKCGDSLDAVQAAMLVSPDHAQLYSQAWFCFSENHVEPLTELTIASWDDGLAELEHHLRGWPLPGDPDVVWADDQKRLPLWFREPVGGVEYRMLAWLEADERDLFDEVTRDLMGDPTVADAFATDVLIQLQVAAAIARTPDAERSPVLDEAWARRVYVATRAMSGRIGRLLRTHRPELVPTLDQLMQAALTPPEGGKLPADVQKAHEVASGDAPDPTQAPVRTAPKSNPLPEEPDLGGGGRMPGGIHR